MATEKRFAVLIDADNVSDKYIQYILDEISGDGFATYKRIYGDWTKPSLGSWKNVLLNNSITPVQQYAYTTGKNATDSAMIIDAMDILYSGSVDGFCLVSSDSDFTRLASRLRESGMIVVGMGERKTPNAFIAACNKFRYLDVLASSDEKKAAEGMRAKLEETRRALLAVVRELSDEDGWAFISDIGNMLIKRYPDFDVRNFGFAKLTTFVRSLNLFESRTVFLKENNAKMIYFREKTAESRAKTPEAPAPIAEGDGAEALAAVVAAPAEVPAAEAPEAPAQTPAAEEDNGHRRRRNRGRGRRGRDRAETVQPIEAAQTSAAEPAPEAAEVPAAEAPAELHAAVEAPVEAAQPAETHAETETPVETPAEAEAPAEKPETKPEESFFFPRRKPVTETPAGGRRVFAVVNPDPPKKEEAPKKPEPSGPRVFTPFGMPTGKPAEKPEEKPAEAPMTEVIPETAEAAPAEAVKPESSAAAAQEEAPAAEAPEKKKPARRRNRKPAAAKTGETAEAVNAAEAAPAAAEAPAEKKAETVPAKPAAEAVPERKEPVKKPARRGRKPAAAKTEAPRTEPAEEKAEAKTEAPAAKPAAEAAEKPAKKPARRGRKPAARKTETAAVGNVETGSAEAPKAETAKPAETAKSAEPAKEGEAKKPVRRRAPRKKPPENPSEGQ